MNSRSEPILFCLIGPGASGKSSICTSLLELRDDIRLSISSTTRAPRPGEQEGVEYFFKSEEVFLSEVAAGKFLEHAQFAGNYYGTSLANIDLARTASSDLLLDIDIQGVKLLKEMTDLDVITIFVCPPSVDEMKKRFRKRGGDDEERIEERVQIAKEEIASGLQEGFSNYFIINNDLEESVQQLNAIVSAEQLRVGRGNVSLIEKEFLKL